MHLQDHRGHIRALELRYVLTAYLNDLGPLTVRELVAAITADGFALRGRPSKTISDARRWEIGRGRVVRLAQGRYGPGHMPRQTASRIRNRVRALRDEIVATRWAD